MHRSALVPFLIPLVFLTACCQPASNATESVEETTKRPQEGNNAYVDMEIISIQVLPKIGNAVLVSWGKPLREYDLNWTYGVYYGLNKEETLQKPKLTTKDLYAKVGNLSFCSQYIFAVGVVDNSTAAAHPARNIRTIGTLIDELAPPTDLLVEYLPEEEPCLLIRWSASCPNIAIPLGYSVTVFEANPPRMTIITHPRSGSAELAQTLRVVYGKSYDIKVASDVVGSTPTSIVSYKVPHFLQPYKVRLTSQPDGAFVMDWREPYVPYYVDDFYYEVYVYAGRGLGAKPQIFATDRPVFQFHGNESVYTFMVGLRSEDDVFKSYFSEPVVQNLLGDSETLTIS